MEIIFFVNKFSKTPKTRAKLIAIGKIGLRYMENSFETVTRHLEYLENSSDIIIRPLRAINNSSDTQVRFVRLN